MTNSTAARTAAVIGHELRNPLAAAVTGAALVGEMVDPDDPRRPLIDAVSSELQRMSELLDGYLAFARSGQPRCERVRLEALCESVAASRPAVAVDVERDVAVTGDGVLLGRVLENLVDNALQAGASRVSIRVHTRGSAVQVVVEDDGSGVPPDLRGRVFEPGFSNRGGTGLGLVIVSETVAGHGGSIRCEAPATGARFVIELPALRGASRHQELAVNA